jgi:hypothetical protein
MEVQVNDPLVLECARAIRLYLPGLLQEHPGAEDKSRSMDRALVELLGEADHGRQVDEAILDVLRQVPEVHNWAAGFLQYGVPPEIVPSADRARYAQPPGDGNWVGARKYACPVAGDTLWWQRTVGQEVPRCLTHGVLLKPDDET